MVDRANLVDGLAILPGDVLIGLPSAGLHTNGYSLARRVFFEAAGWTAETLVPELGITIGERCSHRTDRICRLCVPLLERRYVKGLAHITGGGITENLPRILPEGCAAEIDLRAWSIPPIFSLLQQHGGVSREEMFRAFNMGVGLIVACAARDAERVINMASRPVKRTPSVSALWCPAHGTVRYVDAL